VQHDDLGFGDVFANNADRLIGSPLAKRINLADVMQFQMNFSTLISQISFTGPSQ
jgi:hypothetical protein